MNLTPTDLIAALALTASLTAIAISIWVHRDSAGRVKVRMNAAVYIPEANGGILRKNPDGVFGMPETKEPAVELCQISIENPGRTGVTVTSVSLRLHGLQNKNRTISPRTLVLKDFEGESSRPETHFRLEPYDQRNILFDYWAEVDQAFEENPALEEISLRAEVTVAGHLKSFDSKKHGNWKLKRETISAVSNHTVRRPRNIILTAFLRTNTRDLSTINYLYRYASTVESTLNPAWQYGEFESHMKRLLVEPSMDMVHLAPAPLLHDLAILDTYNQLQKLGPLAEPFAIPEHLADYYRGRGLTLRTDYQNGNGS